MSDGNFPSKFENLVYKKRLIIFKKICLNFPKWEGLFIFEPILIDNSIKMNDEPKFDVVYTKEVYAFLKLLPERVQDKVVYNIDKSRYKIDNELFKKLEGEIWEFRTNYNNLCIRLLAFWDKEQKKVVVATYGFIKKSKKTPQQEIKKAESLRQEYYKSKK